MRIAAIIFECLPFLGGFLWASLAIFLGETERNCEAAYESWRTKFEEWEP